MLSQWDQDAEPDAIAGQDGNADAQRVAVGDGVA